MHNISVVHIDGGEGGLAPALKTSYKRITTIKANRKTGALIDKRLSVPQPLPREALLGLEKFPNRQKARGVQPCFFACQDGCFLMNPA